MSIQTISTHRSVPTRSPERPKVATLEHREQHPITRADCADCLPNPCVCGQMLCPDASQHRRDLVSTETYWMQVAR